MSYVNAVGNDVDDRVPVYKFGDDGRVRNIRPSIFHRRAAQQMQQHGARGRIGYIVKNQYGDMKPMTFKQAQRLHDLFERKMLTIVDFWTVHHVPQEYALTGYDTEMEGHGAHSIYAAPSSGA